MVVFFEIGDSSHKSSRSMLLPKPPSSPSPPSSLISVLDSEKLKMLVLLLVDSAKLSTDVDVAQSMWPPLNSYSNRQSTTMSSSKYSRYLFFPVCLSSSLKLTRISWNWSTLMRGSAQLSTKKVETGLLDRTEFPGPKSNRDSSRCKLSIRLLSSGNPSVPKFSSWIVLVSWLVPAERAPVSPSKLDVDSLKSLGLGAGPEGWIIDVARWSLFLMSQLSSMRDLLCDLFFCCNGDPISLRPNSSSRSDSSYSLDEDDSVGLKLWYWGLMSEKLFLSLLFPMIDCVSGDTCVGGGIAIGVEVST
ncbi:hypothetical protein OGATHE_000630 [Ogataea polymorpha]|uniref:Uncharacterized protein n=1 Tax=Ogataea polymorpha TaxID=460523 RepID=A0A9P8TGP4_9ASCO|nr:hypothetical protein OGATHE_000630 [Ogataea polymorpha]